jgi:phenylalanyl-tRNA synthetase beta chain
MKILERMLKEFVHIPENIHELTNQKIIEVDAFSMLNPSTNLVIGYVMSKEKHPNADTLSVTQVNLGDRMEQIVCGASNVEAGQYVIVAQENTVLPGDFKIKKTKIRGIDSCGMICSLKELGITGSFIKKEFQEGIFYFDQKMEIGSPALDAIGQDGFLMELGLTPNRADLLSVLGFAYDLASMTNQEVKLPKINIQESNQKNDVKVEIKTDGCGRYYLRKFDHIEVRESPWWLKSALLANDIQPINNVVDISNYVLLEYGTPLHMFDAKKVGTKTILVRDAKDGETVVSLDGIKRVLSSEDVVITNKNEVIAIGGVMGLENTMITNETTEILLEAAYFHPKRIFKTSKKLGLRSDSSIRFERGIDDERVLLGLERATELLIELASANVLQGISQAVNYQVNHPAILVKKSYFSDALGVEISESELFDMFRRYRYDVKIKDDSYEITSPSDRIDLLIDADLLEEIARMYGLNKIPMTPVSKPMTGQLSARQKRNRQIRHHLSNIGFNEVITYSLIRFNDVHKYQTKGEPLSLLMPLSEDKKTLRQSLIHGLLETINYNQSRQKEDVFVFEIGNCYAKGFEKPYLGLAISGKWMGLSWTKEKLDASYFLLKGFVDDLFKTFDITLEYQADASVDAYHPYIQANIMYQKEVIGKIARIHPREEKQLDIFETYVCEIELSTILENIETKSFSAISRFPNVTRDIAMVVNEKVSSKELIDLITQTVKKNLVSIDVFDVYQGTHIEKGHKSIAFRLVFNDLDKTLSSDDADKLVAKIQNRLKFAFDASIRS